MRRAAMSSAASLALPHFSTLSHKRYDFREKVTEHRMCGLTFSTTFTFLILRGILWDIVIILKSLHVKYALLLLDFNETWAFSTDFRKAQISSLIKIRTVGAEFDADGRAGERTDMMKLKVAFRNFSYAPKMSIKPSLVICCWFYMLA